MTTVISISESAARRATLQTSSKRWNRNKEYEILPIINSDFEKPMRINGSEEDDLALGDDASLFGKHSLRTVRDFLRSSLDPPALSRWNSFASNVSVPSDVSVMDVLNILQDDPEELLLDLGFGTEEPDITGRIPARFLNYKSSARGISLQVFLEAQQNRMDFENADVRNRFRQLEVLQQVTTTFSSLVGTNAKDASASAEAMEKRRRMAMILRRAVKKSLSQCQKSQTENMSPTPKEASATFTPHSQESTMMDRRVPSKGTRMTDNSSLFTLKEEDTINSESTNLKSNTSTTRGTLDFLKLDFVPSSINGGLSCPVESFDLEEMQSFDEGGATGNSSGPVDPGGHQSWSSVMRANSCQSDSSGFQEEPFVPELLQQNNPRLMKMLNVIPQENPEGQQKSSELGEAQNYKTQNYKTKPMQTQSEQTPDTNTVCDLDLGNLRKVKTENENSLSPVISKEGKKVHTLAYHVQMDPISYQPVLCDRSVSICPDRQSYKEGMSLYEELKFAKANSQLAQTNLGTDVWTKFDAVNYNLEVVKPDSALDLLQDSAVGKNIMSESAFGHNVFTALKLRRESFSRRSWSDVITDNDSGTGQTPLTQTPFTSVDTSPPHLSNLEECSGDIGCLHMCSESVDTGLSYEEEDQRLQGALWAGEERCFHCGSLINYNSAELPYSLDELEDMMRCLRRFRTILTQIEVKLDEDQASAFGSLSDCHREEVEDVLSLRAAVKQEAGILEQQLSDLVHNYDDSIKMKLNRLMDEQSQLCTQLRIAPTELRSSAPTSSRSVAVQCCLLPKPQCCIHHQCTCHGTQTAAYQDPHGFPCQIQWDAHHKPDKLDFVAFIKSHLVKYSAADL
ncbi:hypothetical protein DNTS_004580 [Danionella cerebrum]|uniref:ITPR-interacting domain-containing protein n=1 Tax=Danionella cerebrum TaxID=2873325 RepID=A0A553QGR2_9TELE|nr:hypothetical protein DNTS_004580 [Danionella translucida]